MKRIYNILLAVTSLLVFGAVVSAEDPEEPTYGEWSINGQITDPKTGAILQWPKAAENGIQQPPGTDFAYSKDISSPLSNGTYWIKLESFSTGALTSVISSVPSDIILVLDSSTSLDIYNYVTYTAVNNGEPQGYSYTSYGNNQLYVKYNDQYYQVSRNTSNSTGVRYLSFSLGNGSGNTRYLSGTDIVNTRPNTPTNNTDVIWTGVLYERSSRTRTRALKDATKDFIQEIYDNDVATTSVDSNFDGNRIAIVSYDETSHLLTSSWVDVGATGNLASLQSTVENMSTANWTRPSLGLSAAINTYLDGSDDAHRKRATANLTVVMFTDGVPANNNGGTGNNFDASEANNAIYYGYQLKHDYNATIFTVGILDATSTDQNVRCGIHYLDLLSSNYPNAYLPLNSNATWNASGTTVTVSGITGGSASDKDPDGNYFQLADENNDLSSIFKSFAQQSGGSASQLTASSRNVDIVSNSFILPPGTTADNIGSTVKIFVAKVNGYDTTKQQYTFDEEILKEHTPDTPTDPTAAGSYYYYPLDETGAVVQPAVAQKVDAGIGVSYNETTQAVTVNGFDYSSCFCGPVYNSQNQVIRYQGFKIIIMIPIKMNPNAVGGPDVQTNAAGSGIFVQAEGGSALVQFKSPTVSLPVNIHLKKTGLGAGESAKFKIERAQLPETLPENFNPATLTNWSYVSTVFVTNSPNSLHDPNDGNPIVKVRGLPANMDVTENGQTVHRSFVYRVTEEGWSWSYDPQTQPQYTITSNVTNPFTFNNQKKDNIDVKVRHAESKATNIFKTDDEGTIIPVQYDDSKPNNR